jgi:hypothetical protein
MGRNPKEMHLSSATKAFLTGLSLGKPSLRYPARVGRYVLDGVVDPEDWVSGNGVNEITLTDEVFSTFFLYYNLTGSECAFYSGTTTHYILPPLWEVIINKLNVQLQIH